jgi:hypothetical protein
MNSELPITFSTIPGTKIRLAHFQGRITDEILLDSYTELLKEPEYDPTLNDLVDLRAVTRFEVSSDALRQLISMYQPIDALGHPTRLALVPGSDHTFGMSRMYETMRGDNIPEEIRIFRTMDDALFWLNS